MTLKLKESVEISHAPESLLHSVINTVTEPYNPPSVTKATKARNRKDMPKHKNTPKKKKKY